MGAVPLSGDDPTEGNRTRQRTDDREKKAVEK